MDWNASYRYLTEEIYKKPVIVYNYPKDIKAFYMRLNDDGKTVAAMDVLVPKVRLLSSCQFCACAIFLFTWTLEIEDLTAFIRSHNLCF